MVLSGLDGAARVLFEPDLGGKLITRNFECVGDIFWQAIENFPHVQATVTREQASGPSLVQYAPLR